MVGRKSGGDAISGPPDALAPAGRHLRNHLEDVELLNMTDKQFAERMERREIPSAPIALPEIDWAKAMEFGDVIENRLFEGKRYRVILQQVAHKPRRWLWRVYREPTGGRGAICRGSAVNLEKAKRAVAFALYKLGCRKQEAKP
jgi:hypothetical protein